MIDDLWTIEDLNDAVMERGRKSRPQGRIFRARWYNPIMRDRLFTIISAMSWTIFVSTCAIWIACRGHISIANAPRIEIGSDSILALNYHAVAFIRHLDDDRPEHAIDFGFLAAGTEDDHGGRTMFFIMHYSAILFLSAILPIAWLIRARRSPLAEISN